MPLAHCCAPAVAYCCDFFTRLASVLQPLAPPARTALSVTSEQVSHAQRIVILLPLNTLRQRRRRRRRFAGGERGSRAWNYARALCEDPAATLDDLNEAVTTLEDVGRIARRVFGGAHPKTKGLERNLRGARAALAARETPPSSSPSGDV